MSADDDNPSAARFSIELAPFYHIQRLIDDGRASEVDGPSLGEEIRKHVLHL